ncbi:hypothetical protein ACSQ67_001121 [Phaseolus vulgaris]
MLSSAISLKPFLQSLFIDRYAQSSTAATRWECLGFNKSTNFSTKRVLWTDGFKLSCLVDNREMDVESSSSSFVDDAAVRLSGIEEDSGEPSISTIVMNFENKFDPFGAISPHFTKRLLLSSILSFLKYLPFTSLCLILFFMQPSAIENGPYDYTRSGNPTRDALERFDNNDMIGLCFVLQLRFILCFFAHSLLIFMFYVLSLLAKLDKADRALCFTSGMAALTAVVHLVGTGEEIVAGDDVYGGSDRLLSQVVPRTGVVVKRVNTTDLNEVASAIGPRTKLVWLESPTNPRLQISDIRKIAEMAHSHGALVLVDNSIMSPVLSRPLELGADIVMHSATKFIGGHSDIMAGVLAVKGEK